METDEIVTGESGNSAASLGSTTQVTCDEEKTYSCLRYRNLLELAYFNTSAALVARDFGFTTFAE